MPTAPRDLTLVMGMDKVELDWLPPATPNGSVTYTVQQTLGGPITGITNTNNPVTNQPPGTRVNFTVVAVTNVDSSPESNSVSFCNDAGE